MRLPNDGISVLKLIPKIVDNNNSFIMSKTYQAINLLWVALSAQQTFDQTEKAKAEVPVSHSGGPIGSDS